MSKPPSLSELERPVKLDTVLTEQKEHFEDCTPCRIMGSLAFTTLGIYTYASGRKQLQVRQKEILRSGSRFGLAVRRMGLVGLSASLVAMGVYRLVA